MHDLRRLARVGAVEACRGRRRDEQVRAGLQVELDVEPVAADQAAGRVDEHRMRDARAFRVERLQQPQRAIVAGMHARRMGAVARGRQHQARGPADLRQAGPRGS
jgi:hypothetical protein